MKKLSVICMLFVLMLIAAAPTQAAKFKDVSDSHSLQIEIEYLAQQGIINGYSDGTFKPNAPIAKKHIAAMLVKTLKLSTTNIQDPGYVDVPKSHPYYKEIAAAYTAGIFGKATHFKPDSSISRAFMAKILAHSFQLKSIAQNAVTYADVKTTNEFYRPVQLVTMNNVAQGYTDENHTQYFKPNDLLTRAHFSAFLARAMSLRDGDYTPNTAYTTFYDTIDGEQYRQQFDYQEVDGASTYTYWNLYDVRKNTRVEQSVYVKGGPYWIEGVANSDLATLVPYPFTIGTKYNTLSDPYSMQERQRVLSTNEEVRLAGIRYTNVVVIETAWPEYTSNGKLAKINTSTMYIAKDHGIIGVKDSRGYWVSWISKREAQ